MSPAPATLMRDGRPAGMRANLPDDFEPAHERAGPTTFPGRMSLSSSANLRVLHVAEAFGGGVFEQLRTLTDRLPRHGVTSAIAYGRRPETPEKPSALLSSEVELFALPWEKRTIQRQLQAASALRRACAQWRPDIVHLHSSFAGMVGAVAVPRELAIVYTPHGYSFTMTTWRPPARVLFRGLERGIAARANIIGAVSKSEAMAAQTVTRLSKVRVVNNGIPELERVGTPRAERRPGRPRVVGMGRIVPQRCPEQAAQILQGVSDVADVEWIGDGPIPIDRAPFERRGIAVSGWLERDEALRRLRRAEIYLHPAQWDGQPLAVLEAMALGTVVVASDIAPLRDLVPASQRFRSVPEAVDIMRSILSDDAALRSCLKSQSLVCDGHGAEKMAERWATLYRDLRPGHVSLGRKRMAGRSATPGPPSRSATSTGEPVPSGSRLQPR
jgi:glycosyltransferase involved in cell wall biosynthesis